MRRTRLTPTRSSRHARRAGIFLVSTGLVIVWSLAGVRTLQAAPGGPGGMLSVHLSGGGSGAVTSVPAGIDCGPTCSSQFTPGTVVSLTAAPDGGSFFSHWSGACAGSEPVCTVTVDQNTSATANFALTPTPPTPHPTPASTPPTATPTPRPSPRPSSPGGTPPPTQPGTGGTGTSQSPGASSLATDSGGPSVNPDSSAPALGAVASPFDTGPSATPTVIAAGFGQGEAALIVAVAAVLTAIIIAVGIAVIAIADRRAREKRRVMEPRR